MRIEPISRISSMGAIKPIESVTSKPKVSDVSFIDVIKNIVNTDTIKAQQIIKSSYGESYLLDISSRGLKAVNQYKNDSYPIINSDIFSYTKNLVLIYKN